jgi:hypothetical protein
MRYGIVVSASLAACVVSSAALAEETTFGSAKTLVISDDQPINLGSVGSIPLTAGSQSTVGFEYGANSGVGGAGGSSSIAFGVAPAADFFVIPNLSVGGQLLFDYYSFGSSSTPSAGGGASGSTSNPSTNITVLGIAPRVGYNIRLTDWVSFWPKLYVSYATTSASQSGADGSSGSNSFTLGLYAPFMIHPAKHVFFGIGPNFLTQLSANTTTSGGGASTSTASSKLTEVGLQATIGGWFLGN